ALTLAALGWRPTQVGLVARSRSWDVFETKKVEAALQSQVFSQLRTHAPISAQGGKMGSTMTKIFGATSATEDVLSGIDLRGKRILVTGVSAGLGIETARSLAAHGAQVIGAARDLAKAKNATAQARKDAIAGAGSFELVELDLASLKNVRACADGLLARGE